MVSDVRLIFHSILQIVLKNTFVFQKIFVLYGKDRPPAKSTYIVSKRLKVKLYSDRS